MHLPAFDRGITSFVWAIVFGIFVWIGGSALGYSSALTFVVGCVVAFLSFLFIRVYGDDEPRRP